MAEPVGGGRGKVDHAARRAARRLALAAIFEAEFGQRTAKSALERQLREANADQETGEHARQLVAAVVRHRDRIDSLIEAAAPAYPVVQLARIDRALLRSALGELLHSPATPTRVAISEWVALARDYSGEPARRLLNGVLGRISAQVAGSGQGSPPPPSEANGGRRPPQEENG